MISYESFFLLILVSILGPVIGFLVLIFYNSNEKRVYVLEMENRQVKLEKDLEISRYLQLSQQIQPHFLFNALNSLLGLVRLRQYERLSESFEHLALYLRSKYMDKEPLYPLSKEIEYTMHYLTIQQLRFGERLSVEWKVENGVEEALVIPYLLQTLVENAFKHGLEMTEEQAKLSINIGRLLEDRIFLYVKDNGPGFLKDPFAGEGGSEVGLRNIERRLSLLFGSQASIAIGNEAGAPGGAVTVVWPNSTQREGNNNESACA
ncbi:sensor histidine kinase [Paenibacillus turpanensis]|uniref:sensor histidine kinase n=1 Tax=Paenibacillus turpanensis TaxID=2689078 RepID=UPI00140B5EBD|nr:histidine kinase [Paenibacillus turpanensis]